uniref:Uncharacterized protein n=1 Tax=Arundo donax TaxID=35708 RepID=A0A0A9G9F1_ARUDO
MKWLKFAQVPIVVSTFGGLVSQL